MWDMRGTGTEPGMRVTDAAGQAWEVNLYSAGGPSPRWGFFVWGETVMWRAGSDYRSPLYYGIVGTTGTFTTTFFEESLTLPDTNGTIVVGCD